MLSGLCNTGSKQQILNGIQSLAVSMIYENSL